MLIDNHLEVLKESIEMINESIEIGIAKRQRTIGFNTSAAAVDMLEIYLHRNNLIDPGFMIKHEWLKSKNKLNEKFSFDFKEKKKIFELMYEIEEKRNVLCYGKPQSVEVIMKTIEAFNELKEIFRKNGISEV
ncbi:MAG: hypothetical protein V1859_10000 [archaeon]